MQGLTSSPGDGGIAGLNILLVEDEFLLACSLEEDLRAAGAHVVGMYSGLTAARDGARRGGFDLAILDVNLNGEMVYPLADELLAAGKPFLFLTGYVAMQLPERFRTQARVAKPYDPLSLVREIRRVAQR